MPHLTRIHGSTRCVQTPDREGQSRLYATGPQQPVHESKLSVLKLLQLENYPPFTKSFTPLNLGISCPTSPKIEAKSLRSSCICTTSSQNQNHHTSNSLANTVCLHLCFRQGPEIPPEMKCMGDNGVVSTTPAPRYQTGTISRRRCL